MADRRLEHDSVLKCPGCGCEPYRVWRRQNAQANGELLPTFQNVLWPNEHGVLPPCDPTRIECPKCRTELRRVTA